MEKNNVVLEADAPVMTKKRNWGTIIFYSIYALFVVAAIVGILCLLNPLHDWLVKYQASQPETKCQEVFQQYFADPDWEDLYVRAGVEDTAFEDKAAYAAYMEEKVGETELICMETSAGLSGDHKYVIRLGEEKIATFLLTPGSEGDDHITTWELGTMELFFQRQKSVTVEKSAGETVYINAVALSDDYTVKKTSTLTEPYLPEGLHGYRREAQTVTGLLMDPVVTVKDAAGNEVPVRENDDGVFCTDVAPMEISDAEYNAAVGAAKAYALYVIRAVGQGELRKHFDTNSPIYKDICETLSFMQDYLGYAFDESATSVTEFYRYSDTFFSCRIELNLNVTRTNNTIKTYESSTNYFFQKQADGSYKAVNITNVPISELTEQVRLTFMNDGQLLDSQFVDVNAQSITLPTVTAPEGQQLRGWAKNDVDEKGQNVLVIVFTPSEDGTVTLTDDSALEAMTLYPVFEKKDA